MTEGVGSALATTTALALIPGLYPDRVSTIMVCLAVHADRQLRA